MKFKVASSGRPRQDKDGWIALLEKDNWDDYSYCTTFHLRLIEPSGTTHNIGIIKIGQIGLKTGVLISEHPIPAEFDTLDDTFFSLGQSDAFYVNLKKLGPDIRQDVLTSLRDIAFDEDILDKIKEEGSFEISLMRSNHINTVCTQFRRLAKGGERHEAFSFAYTYPMTPQTRIDFSVRPGSNPPTNVHVLIGRNAVGKTTLLTRLEDLVRNPKMTSDSTESFGFVESQDGTDSFWNLGTVAFSAFDTFGENLHEKSSASGPEYQYFGLKKPPSDVNAASTTDDHKEVDSPEEVNSKSHDGIDDSYIHKSSQDIVNEFEKLIREVERSRSKQFGVALSILSSDPLIRASILYQQFDPSQDVDHPDIDAIVSEFREMSSGHKIVAFTIAGLVSCVDEKTLILIDEPETHLHPPLLSAFVRAVSNLLIDRNGVAIIATHSPVVLQEVPQSCVWILSRYGNEVKSERPAIETFGENVGTLTREVFGLEVTQSGFYHQLARLVETCDSYEEVLDHLGGQLGSEGKAMVRVLLSKKEAT